jgi:hypothetical protein
MIDVNTCLKPEDFKRCAPMIKCVFASQLHFEYAIKPYPLPHPQVASLVPPYIISSVGLPEAALSFSLVKQHFSRWNPIESLVIRFQWLYGRYRCRSGFPLWKSPKAMYYWLTPPAWLVL